MNIPRWFWHIFGNHGTTSCLSVHQDNTPKPQQASPKRFLVQTRSSFVGLNKLYQSNPVVSDSLARLHFHPFFFFIPHIVTSSEEGVPRTGSTFCQLTKIGGHFFIISGSATTVDLIDVFRKFGKYLSSFASNTILACGLNTYVCQF